MNENAATSDENTPIGADAHAASGRKSRVKRALTRKRPRHEVETLDYLGAAKRFILAAGRRVGDADEHELRALLLLQVTLDEAIQTAVDGQRENGGKSWADIARGTGKSREAAYQRWGAK
jgi:hypothetical protein